IWSRSRAATARGRNFRSFRSRTPPAPWRRSAPALPVSSPAIGCSTASFRTGSAARPAKRTLRARRAACSMACSANPTSFRRTPGADETINYRAKPEWGKQARALTAGRGVDLVIEVGGAGTLNESLRATRIGGTLAMIGVLAGPANDLRLPLVVMQQLRLQGV